MTQILRKALDAFTETHEGQWIGCGYAFLLAAFLVLFLLHKADDAHKKKSWIAALVLILIGLWLGAFGMSGLVLTNPIPPAPSQPIQSRQVPTRPGGR